MNDNLILSGPKTMEEIIQLSLNFGNDKWVYYKIDNGVNYSEFYVRETDSKCLTDQEYDQLDDSLSAIGLNSFLLLTTIEDVIKNLSAQVNSPSLKLMSKAVIYYYENDAFLKVSA